jgi:hypothetical protein
MMVTAEWRVKNEDQLAGYHGKQRKGTVDATPFPLSETLEQFSGAEDSSKFSSEGNNYDGACEYTVTLPTLTYARRQTM